MHKWKYHTERPEKYTRHKVEISLKDSTENHSHNELQQFPELSISSKAKVSKDGVLLLPVQRRLQIQGKVSQQDEHTLMSIQMELHICKCVIKEIRFIGIHTYENEIFHDVQSWKLTHGVHYARVCRAIWCVRFYDPNKI